MSSRSLPKVSAVIGLALAMILTGCPSLANNGHLDPVVTSVTVVPASNHGEVFEGEEGTLYYLITVVGEGLFPFNLQTDVVVTAVTPSGQVQLPDGISVNEGTVAVSGEAFTLSFSVNRPSAATYSLIVTVLGVSSAPFYLNVAPVSPVASVNVAPHPTNPGTAISGIPSTLNYLITIGVALMDGIFPVDLLGPYVDITLADGTPLPDGIAVNEGTVTTSGVASPLSFSVNKPEGVAYSLIVRVHGRTSAPFDLVVVPALAGIVTLDGAAQLGGTLTANTGALGGAGALSFRWEVGTYPNFNVITGEVGETYAVRASDLNQTVRVIVTREGYYGFAMGGPTLPVADPGDAPLGGTATISYEIPQDEILWGEILRVGQELRAGAVLGAGVSPVFQWQRGIGSSFVPIFGAIGETYVVRHDDVGQTVRVVVTSIGHSHYVASEPTAVIAPKLSVAERIAALHGMASLPSRIYITTSVADEQIALQTLLFAGTTTITLRSGTPGDALYLSRPGTMFTVGNGVTLVLEDIALRGMGTANPNSNALVVVGDRGILEMRAGSAITDNNNTSNLVVSQGGGVRVNAGGVFTMLDGEISGNDAPGGGGVFVGGTATNPSVFTMRGGEIFDNLASQGGGVNIESGGTFSMEGGTIFLNIAQIGGGVFNSGFFTLNDDVRISGNYAISAGGGVFNAGTFTMDDGEISRNVTFSQGGGAGGGVFNEGTFNMENGQIFENFAENPAGGQGSGGGVANWIGGTFAMRGGEIFGNGAQTFGGGVINAGPGTFTMEGGEIFRNMALSQGGGVNNNAGGTFVMRHGEISGNIAAFGGGVSSLSVFTMHDGEISDNDAHQGGGVRINDGTFTMHSGIISYNRAVLGITGAGASLNMGGGVSNLGTFNMLGGLVNNENIAALGGGVENRGLFNIQGGAISDNVAIYGGGVENLNVFNMRGNAVISGNEAQWGGGVENLGLFNMEGGRISGNMAHHADGGGGVENAGGIFRMSNGIIYGSNAEVGDRNIAPSFAALVNADLTIGEQTFEYEAQHGTFNGTFAALGDLLSTDYTIEVENGRLVDADNLAARIVPFAATGNMMRYRWMSPEGFALPQVRTLPEGLALSRMRTLPEGLALSAEEFTLSAEEFTLTERLDVPSLRRALEQNMEKRVFRPLPSR